MDSFQEAEHFDKLAGLRAQTLSQGESAPLDPDDLIACFNLFLGCMPGPASDDFETTSVPVLLRSIFGTEEFKAGVLQPVLLREALPHQVLGDSLPLRMIDWAQRRLPISDFTKRITGGARTWPQLLEVLLSDAGLLSAAPVLLEAEIDRILRERLANEPLSRIKRSVIGVVDAANAFEVRGWAVDLCDKSTPVILEFYADSTLIGATSCGEARPDVQDLVGGNGNFGFTFKISSAHRPGFARGRVLTAIDSVSRERIGTSTVAYADAVQNWDAISATRSELSQVRQLLERIEARLPEVGRMASVPMEAYGEYWERFYRLSPEAISAQRRRSAELSYQPLISVVVPTWNSDTRLLDKAIKSVLAQTWEDWELVMSDDASDRDELRLMRHRFSDPRIRWIDSLSRGGIARNTNRGIAAATGDYVAFLDHDDELTPDALYHVAVALQKSRHGLLYSDEDRIENDGFGRYIHHTPFFKPDFDPDLLLAINYMCHLVVFRRGVLTELGGLRFEYDGAQDHDLLLRAVASLPQGDIYHIPRILYHWRVTPGSVSRTPSLVNQIQGNIVSAVEDHLSRLHVACKVEAHNDPAGPPRPFATRVRWCLPAANATVSIIVPTRDKLNLLQPCLESVIDSLQSYPGRHEILLVDNESVERATLAWLASISAAPGIRLIPFRGPFNWSAINNAAAREASGDVLIFLNNDTIVLTKDWCAELAANALRQDVGAAGARLLYSDGTIQHAGVLLGVEGVAGHECVSDSCESGGYFGRTQLLRSAAAVTGACLATRRELFNALGGFDDLHLKIAFSDVDYCMKVRKAGYRVVYNPYAVLYHFESKSRGRELTPEQQARHRQEVNSFRARWTEAEIRDPYYNSHFERFARPFDRLRPPPNEAAEPQD